jgi:hypothetical protein
MCALEDLSQQWKESIIVPIYKKIYKAVKEYHCYELHINFIQHSCLKVNSI